MMQKFCFYRLFWSAYVDENISLFQHLTVGVAQWLGRRSLSGDLSMIYAVDMYSLRVRYGSTNQANSAFHPSGVGK